MEVSEAKRIVSSNVSYLRDQLRLWDWHLDVLYERLNVNTLGSCDVHAAYCRATIKLDNDQIEDEPELLRVLRHELIHVFCWPMHAYGLHVEEMTEGRSLDSAWVFNLERMVWSVELLMDKHAPILPLASDAGIEISSEESITEELS